MVIVVAGCSINHQERAHQHLLKSLQEYEKSISENPEDVSLQEKYYALARIGLGEIQAKTELFLLYRKIHKNKEADNILHQLSSENPAEASQYLEKKLLTAYNLLQRIEIYRTLAYLNGQNPSYFDSLGRLYLGTGETENGIKALSRSVELGNRNIDSVKYLVRLYLQKNQYEDAITMLNRLLAEKDDQELRKQLAEIYKKQGEKDLYLAEMRKIKGEKQLLVVFRKPEIQKPISEKKPAKPEAIMLSEKIDIEPYRFIVADKSTQTVMVYQFDGVELKEVFQAPCTTGKNMEDKKKPGDLATPEGSFLFTSFIPGEKLDPKYGAGAFVLDFPDYLSRRLNKDGSGIWIHGTPIERPPYNSEGCVVLNDRDFLSLKEYIEPGKTYIHIVKQTKDINFSEMINVWKTVQQWEQSWESLNTEQYLSFYGEKFKSDGKDKKTWSEYKKRVNRNKKYVKIEMEKPVLVPYGNTDFGYVFLLDFIQKYESNDLKSTTRKNLYLAKENGSYKIIGELVK